MNVNMKMNGKGSGCSHRKAAATSVVNVNMDAKGYGECEVQSEGR